MENHEPPKIERIKRAIKWLIGDGVAQNQEEVGRLLGYGNKSSFSQVINNEGKMPGDFTTRLSALSDKLNKVWLDTGEGEMLKTSDGTVSPRQKGTIRYWVDVDATGGDVVLFDDTLTKTYIDLSIPEFRDCTDAVNLYGDSMHPRYKSGQIIILREWRESFIEFGYVYLIITKNGHRMVKYIRSSDSKDSVMCVSENPEYDPFPLKLEDIHKLYLVKGAIEKATL